MSNTNDFVIEDGVLKSYIGPGGCGPDNHYEMNLALDL